MFNFDQGQTITSEEFEEAWEMSERQENMQNLLCEMIVWGDLTLTDWNALFYPIADVGVREFLYYMNLEKQLKHHRQLDMKITLLRKVRLANHQPNIQVDSEQLVDQLPK